MKRSTLALVFPLLLAYPLACGIHFGIDEGVTSGDGGGLPTPATTIVGGSVGDACTTSMPCRTGIACVGGVCAVPMGSDEGGASCEIGPECSTGNCGPNRTCDPAGMSPAGGGCAGDADCAKGLRCAFDGISIFPSCVAEGTKDYGQPCTTTLDCYQGLTCNVSTGKCDVPFFPPGTTAGLTHGLPPYIPSLTTPPWAGAMCPAPVTIGAVTARFHVPRAGDPMDGDFYKLPFPNDAARDASGNVSYANHPHDPSPPIGFDVLKRYLDVLSSEPFSNYPTVYFTFNGPFNFASITADGNDPQLRWVDLTGQDTDTGWGQRLGFQFYTTDGGNKYICPNYLAVRPPRGQPLKPGGVYAVILKAGVTTLNNNLPATQDSDLTALLSATPPTDAALTTAYTAYAPLRDYLSKAQPTPIDPAQVVSATIFTVGKPTAAAAQMRPSVRAIATAPAVHNWTLCSAGVTSPCPQHDGDRNCGTPAAGFDEYAALVDMPIFQQGTAPYLGVGSGGNIDLSQPIVAPVRTESVCMGLTVPKGAAPASGWPVVIYAPGTGGSYRSQAIDGSAAMLSSIDLGGGMTAGFAVLGIDQIGHGPRRCGGMTTCTPDVSIDDAVFNFGNPQAARFNYIQGAADQHTLARVVETLAIDPAVATSPTTFDATKTVYWGHSQGATEGALFLATDGALQGAVLSGEAGGFIESLLTKVSPVDIKDGLWLALSESSASAVNIYHPVLSLLQNWIDPSDPIHFAALDVTPTVPMGVTPFPRNIFQPSGTSDTYTPFPVQITYATAGGLGLVSPVVDDLGMAFGSNLPASVSGNIMLGGLAIDGGPETLTSTAALRQYTPGATYDGHFVAYDNATAQGDVTKFLAQVAMGQLPKIPE
jgi:hypothetical protein